MKICMERARQEFRLLCNMLIQIVLLDLVQFVGECRYSNLEDPLKHNSGRPRSATDGINTEMRTPMISAGFLPRIGFLKDRRLIKNIMSTF